MREVDDYKGCRTLKNRDACVIDATDRQVTQNCNLLAAYFTTVGSEPMHHWEKGIIPNLGIWFGKGMDI